MLSGPSGSSLGSAFLHVNFTLRWIHPSASASNPHAKCFFTGYPRKSLNASHWFWLTYVPIPEPTIVVLGNGICWLSPHLNDIWPRAGEKWLFKHLMLANRWKNEYKVAPSHKCLIYDFTPESKKDLTFFTSASLYVFYSLQQAIIGIPLNPNNTPIKEAGWQLSYL